MRVLLLAMCIAPAAAFVLAEDDKAPPCEGVMCQFLSAFREDLGKISSALEQQVTLLQGASHSSRVSLLRTSKKKGDPKDPMLASMVGMMGDMYDKMKERIGKANAAEKKAKVDFEGRIADLEAKKKAMQAKGMKIDDTYDRIENYWKKQRNNSHRQYHNLLKITHAGMSKFETMLHLGKDAQEGKPLDKQAFKDVTVGVPNVVFVQEVVQWARQSRSAITQDMRTA